MEVLKICIFICYYICNIVNENEVNRVNVYEIIYLFLLFNLNNN